MLHTIVIATSHVILYNLEKPLLPLNNMVIQFDIQHERGHETCIFFEENAISAGKAGRRGGKRGQADKKSGSFLVQVDKARESRYLSSYTSTSECEVFFFRSAT